MNLQQKIKSLGFKYEYIDDEVADSIKSSGITGEVELFKLNRYATPAELQTEYEKRGLVPDFFAVIDWMKENPKELDEKKYIAVQQSDNSDLTFNRWDDGRRVSCGRDGHGWRVGWWFSGVRKLPLETGKLGASGVLDSGPLDALPEILVINGITYKKVG